MLFIKSALTLSALLGLASALSLDRVAAPAHQQMSILTEVNTAPSFSHSSSECEKEDAADCKEFCEAAEQTATCSANGNKACRINQLWRKRVVCLDFEEVDFFMKEGERR
ncbi:hypothetical protein LOCC1_G005819 [Lachnellula occidentalis]|uniref:Extracellular membrane protein CFEM domain-containing protein n=1 Tax=Lachnellula occidentalis TaxID=215460 RepID=A0A8H8UCM6_9HELO|nr:hypothetical protein LOCC1_G005819 [Lachnellula occidentalis]